MQDIYHSASVAIFGEVALEAVVDRVVERGAALLESGSDGPLDRARLKVDRTDLGLAIGETAMGSPIGGVIDLRTSPPYESGRLVWAQLMGAVVDELLVADGVERFAVSSDEGHVVCRWFRGAGAVMNYFVGFEQYSMRAELAVVLAQRFAAHGVALRGADLGAPPYQMDDGFHSTDGDGFADGVVCVAGGVTGEELLRWLGRDWRYTGSGRLRPVPVPVSEEASSGAILVPNFVWRVSELPEPAQLLVDLVDAVEAHPQVAGWSLLLDHGYVAGRWRRGEPGVVNSRVGWELSSLRPHVNRLLRERFEASGVDCVEQNIGDPFPEQLPPIVVAQSGDS